MTETPHTELASPPPARRGRWFRRVRLLVLILAPLAALGWRYRITRPEYRLARGHEAMRANDHERVGQFADRLEASGHADLANLLRGEALLHLGSPKLALVQFNKIAADGPVRQRAAVLAGRALLAIGDLREAHRVFSVVVAEQPDNPDGHRGLAAIAYDLGHSGQAIDFLTRVAELDPHDSRPHNLIGLICKDLRLNVDAEAAYEECLRRGGLPSVERDAKLGLAEVQTRLHKYAEGLEMIRDVEIASAGEQPNPVAVRAECLRGLGRTAESAAVLDAALVTHPSAILHRVRGQTYQDAGDLPQAVRSFERSVELDPHEPQSHYLLAQAYTAAGRKDEATRAYAKLDLLRGKFDAITRLSSEAMEKPWDANVRLKLADLSDDMGQPKLAQMWRKAAAACAESER